MNKRKEKIIYKAYKKFYGKEPNLNRDNIRNLTIEIQSMTYILNEYGVSLGAEGFCYEYTDLSMPMSMNIQDIVVEKLIGNSDDLNDDSLQFTEFAEKTINIVGRAVMYVINNSQDQIETLRELCNTLYVKEHVLPLASDDEITEASKCTERDLRNVEQLIELINQEKCKDNFDKTNVDNVRKMIDEEEPASYRMLIDESGNGENPKITKESRKKLAKSLIN